MSVADDEELDVSEDDIAYDDYDEMYEYGFDPEEEYDSDGNPIEEYEEEPVLKGRPRQYYSKPKIVQLKCSSYEHEMLKELAKMTGKSMTKIIKECAINKLNELKMKQ